MSPGAKAALGVAGWLGLVGAAVWLVRRESAERIPGGLASGYTPEQFNQYELARGVQVELEHTSDPFIAREIAMDHLAEDPRYYDKLERAGL